MHALEKRNSPINTFVDSVFDKNAADFWLQKVNPLWSVHQSLGKIVQKESTAADTVSLTIQCNRHFRMGQAGQHHPVIVECQGRRYERTYSLTQLDARHILLTVKKVAQGIVSSWLVEQSKVGDKIEFGQPYGDMTLAKTSSAMVLLAAGSGITPMYSLIQAMNQSQINSQQSVTLLYWVKKQGDEAFKEYFEQLAVKNSNFKVQIFYTQESHPDARLNTEHLVQLADLTQSVVYTCGPSGFVSTAEALFENVQNFKSEAFSLTPVISNDVGFVNITLTQSNKTLAIPKGQSILVALEQQNIKPKHGCRMGICNKCACNKAQGATKNLVNGAENKEPGNLLRICVSSAQTDLVLDI